MIVSVKSETLNQMVKFKSVHNTNSIMYFILLELGNNHGCVHAELLSCI